MTTCPDCHGRGCHVDQDEMGFIAAPCETCRGDGEVEGDADDRADNAYRDGEIRRGL